MDRFKFTTGMKILNSTVMNKQCIISTILYTFVDDKERKDFKRFRF